MGRTTGIVGTEGGSGAVDASTSAIIFKAAINSGSLPGISASSVPVGRTWIAQGVCKLVEAKEFTGTAATTGTATGIASSTNNFGTESGVDSGTTGHADSGGTGGSFWQCGWIPYICARYCSHYCARYCAHYCARYCGLGGYGYGFGYGYGYGTARGYSATCTAIGVHGSTSWTQVVPTGFTVTSWLYYEEEANY